MRSLVLLACVITIVQSQGDSLLQYYSYSYGGYGKDAPVQKDEMDWKAVGRYIHSACKDSHYRCILWAHQGHCDLKFMQVFCCATCSAPGVLPNRRPHPRPRPTRRPWTWRPRPTWRPWTWRPRPRPTRAPTMQPKRPGISVMCRDRIVDMDVVGPRQLLQSPGYPHAYRNNHYCRTEVRSRHGLRMKFTDLDMECGYDWVIISDNQFFNNRTGGILSPKLCDQRHRERLTKNGWFKISASRVYFRLRSDGSVSDRGFNLIMVEDESSPTLAPELYKKKDAPKKESHELPLPAKKKAEAVLQEELINLLG